MIINTLILYIFSIEHVGFNFFYLNILILIGHFHTPSFNIFIIRWYVISNPTLIRFYKSVDVLKEN